VDHDIYGEENTPPTRYEVVQAMLPYLDYWVEKGLKLNAITRHLLELFAGQSGTKAWKRHISENAHLRGANSQVIQAALAKVPYD
jgi:tRNA-dihydrouridine synthase A